MYNHFILVGLTSDLAGIKRLDVFTVLKQIARKEIIFISRGDNSGTYFKEKELWAKVGIEPKGDWYLIAGQGMGETLTLASEMGFIPSLIGQYSFTGKKVYSISHFLKSTRDN